MRQVTLTTDEVRDIMLALAPVPWTTLDEQRPDGPGMPWTQFGGHLIEMLQAKLEAVE